MNKKISAFIDVIDLLPEAWCIVDANSRYIYYNHAYLKMIGAEHLPRYDLIGKTVADMPCKAAACAELFWKEDATVRATKRNVTVLNIIKMENDQWWVVQINKTPILNDNDQVEAIVFHFIDHSNSHFLELALQVSKNKLFKPNNSANVLIDLKLKKDTISLGSKESAVLFYLIKGLSYKEIAAFQNISYSTVVDHVERLKNKFDALTLDALIKNALLNGYPRGMPQNMFDQQFSIVFSE